MSSMLLVGSYRSHIGFDSKQKFDVSESSVFEYRITSIQFGVLKHFSPWDIFGLWGIETLKTQKVRQEKLLKFIKIFNYIKFLCIIFCDKLF